MVLDIDLMVMTMNSLKKIIINFLGIATCIIVAVFVISDFKINKFVNNINHQWSELLIMIILLLMMKLFFDYRRYLLEQKQIELINSEIKRIEKNHELKGSLHEGNPYLKLFQSLEMIKQKQDRLLRKYSMQRRGYLSLLEYLEDGIALIDVKGKVKYYNSSMRDLFGVSTSLKNTDYRDWIYDIGIQKIIKKTIEMRSDQRELAEFRSFKYKNKNMFANIHTIFIPDEKRDVMMIIIKDITMLKEKEKRQSELISNVSHEIRTPITSIMGFSETLLEGAKDEPEILEEFLGIIYKESKKLNEMVEDMLVLAKEGNQRELVIEKINLYQMIVEIFKLRKKELLQKDISYSINMPEDTLVHCDRIKLKHIIENLIQNAIRYNCQGGKIIIKLNDFNQDSWSLSVVDTGIGISIEEQEKVFERFYRVDKSHSKKINGTGLGLAIVKDSIEILSGRIKLKSKLNEGTEVKIVIPNFIMNQRGEKNENL